jgi:anti-anti-sigma factor
MAMDTSDFLPARLMFVATDVGTPRIIRLSGELDICSAPMVENAMSAVWWRDTDLIVDISELAFCDCTGISVFIRVAQRYMANGGQLRLAGPDGIVRSMFTLVDLDAAVPIYTSVAGAIADDPADRLNPAAHGPGPTHTHVLAADP